MAWQAEEIQAVDLQWIAVDRRKLGAANVDGVAQWYGQLGGKYPLVPEHTTVYMPPQQEAGPTNAVQLQEVRS